MADLVTFEQLDALLNLKQSEDNYPALRLLMDSVKAAIQNHIGRDISFGKYTESRIITCQTSMIGLKALPIKSVSAVTIDGVSTTNYKIRDYGIEVPGGLDDVTIAVTYKGGFDKVPEDINRAALLQTAYEFQNKANIGAESVTNEGGSIQRPALGLLKEVRERLKNYKHPLRM